MRFERGQIILHNFPLPNKDTTECHPVVIISNEDVTDNCNMYVALMITSSDNYKEDIFTFVLKDEHILNNRLTKKNKFVRLHLITYFSCNHARSDIKGTVKDSVLDLILDAQRFKVFDNE